MWQSKLYKLIKRISEIGVDKEPEESLKKNVIVSNLFYVINLTLSISASTFSFFLGNNKHVAALHIVWAMLLLPLLLYLNYKGRFTAAKVFFMFVNCYLACAVYFWWLSRHSLYKELFLMWSAIIPMLFTWKERKWVITLEILFISSFIAQSAGVVNYLPGFRHMKDLEAINTISQWQHVLALIGDVMLFIYINKRYELELTRTQKELEQSQKQLRIQNEDLQTFSATASHSIQNSVYVAQSFLNKVDRELQLSKEGSKHKKSIIVMKKNLSRMEHLVDALFLYQRIIQVEEDFEYFDATKEFDIVKKVMVSCYPGAMIHIPKENCFIKTNRFLFNIIIKNIFDNGIKYNISQEKRISVNVQHSTSNIIFSISDNGVGFEKKYYEKIFQPFSKLRKANSSGTRLGLASARRAAKRIDGFLICKNSSPSGSFFELCLPLN